MLQIATFELPARQDEANAFLRTHKPMGEIARMGDLLFVAFDNGEYSPDYEIADCRELLDGARRIRLQHEIALTVMRADQARLNPKQNKNEFDSISGHITNTLRTMDTEARKVAVVEQRIKELEAIKNGTSTSDTAPEKAAGKKATKGGKN